MRSLVVLFVIAALMLAGMGSATAAHNHYDESARRVANEIDCKNFRRTGGGELHKDAGICRVKGKRVNVITFRGSRQQQDWNAIARFGLPSNHWWANGKGAVVTARDGNRAAARIGARRLSGVLRHG